MVKSKKMSKTSIAVIVLAILLVLSLCLGLTGAWFTDKSDGNTNEQTIDFGAVRVQYTADAENTKWFNAAGTALGETRDVLPGDYYDVKGSIAFSGADVGMYVLLTVSSTNLDSAYDGLITITDMAVTGANVAKLAAVAGVTPAAGEAFYKIEKADLAEVFAVAGKIQISPNLPNVVTVSGSPVQLNGGELAVNFGLSVRTIQADNITAQAAYDALHAGVPAFNAAA